MCFRGKLVCIVDLGLIQYPHKQSIRRDRNCSGGGIIFYFKSFVNVIRRQDLEHGDLLELIWFELKTKFQSIPININYRSMRQTPAYYWQYFDFILPV
jgi:hypothetical protein